MIDLSGWLIEWPRLVNGSGDWIDGESDELIDSLSPVLFPCVDSRCPTWTGACDLETEVRARSSERGGRVPWRTANETLVV